MSTDKRCPVTSNTSLLVRKLNKHGFIISCSTWIKRLLRTKEATVEHPFRASRQVFGKTILDSDGEDHIRIRKLLIPHMGKQHIDILTESTIIPIIEQVWLDAHKIPAFEFQSGIAERIPLKITLAWMGISDSLEPWFLKKLQPVVAFLDDPNQSLAIAYSAREEMEAFFRELYAKSTFESTHLCGVLYNHYQNSAISHTELIQTSTLMVAAGFATTAYTISTLMVRILENQEWLDRHKNDQAALEGFVLETLRLYPPLQETIRFATETLEIENIQIPKGSLLVLSLADANRNEKLHEEASNWCPMRKNKQSFSFGDGSHSCLGSIVALSQLNIFLRHVIPLLSRLEPLEHLPKSLYGNAFFKHTPFLLRWKSS